INRRFYGAFVVGVKIITVRAVEGVNIPEARMVALVDNFKRLEIPRGDVRSPGFDLVEEIGFVYLLRFGVVRDEDNFYILVLLLDELIEEEIETPCEVLLHGAHRSGSVHDAEDDCVRDLLCRRDDMEEAHVVLVEGEAILFVVKIDAA